MQKITPFLWFEDNAEEAANFYVSIFGEQGKNSKILAVTHYDEEVAKAAGRPVGSVMTVAFQLDGQQFVAINGGPPPTGEFQAFDRTSFVINCQTQEEVDYFWEKLSADGGQAGQCGWINHDKFGITWQVTPIMLQQLMIGPDREKARKAMKAMLGMTKLNIKELEDAYKEE